jgi:hypothetical protein
MSDFDELATLPGSPQERELLRRQLSSLNEQENTILAAAILRQPPTTAAEAAEHLRSLDKYTVCTPAGSYRQLGIYYLEHETNCPPEIYPYVDLEQLGELYEDNHPGLFIGNCFVAYPHDPSMAHADQQETAQDTKDEWIIQVKLTSSSSQNGVWLKLPLDNAKRALQTNELSGAEVTEIKSIVPNLVNELPMDCATMEDANKLALAVKEMQEIDGEVQKYLAVLDAEQPKDFPEALELALNLDDYERITNATYYDYGREALRRIGADDEILDTIDGYMDFDSFGENAMAEDGIRFTKYGSIRRLSAPFQEEAPGQTMM